MSLSKEFIFDSHSPFSPSFQQLIKSVTLWFLFVCTLSNKILIPTPEVKKRANAPLDPTASYSTRSFVKCKLELVGKNADGKRETKTVIIINIYIPLLLNGEIYTIQSQKDIGQRCMAAQLSLELGMNIFITYCCIPNGENL